MNYDNWKLTTPPDGEGINDGLFECFHCGQLLSTYAVMVLDDEWLCSTCLDNLTKKIIEKI